MKWVRQLTPNGCGAACVAMICGLTFQEAVAAVGTKGLTRFAHLRMGLRLNGWRWGPVKHLVRGGRPIPCMSIVLLRTDNVKKGHWVVYTDGTFWDPARGQLHREDYPAYTRPVAYMPVYPGGEPGGEAAPDRPVGRQRPALPTVG